MSLVLRGSILVLVALVWIGCQAADQKGEGGGSDTDPTNDCSPDGSTECIGGDFMICENGDWTLEETCDGDTPICDGVLGCVYCTPNQPFCEGNSAMLCNGDGSGATLIDECDEGETCVDGACSSDCADVAQSKSYLGCNFIAVPTTNQLLDSVFDNDFAVIVGNPEGQSTAEITVSRGGSEVATASVAPGDTAAITLPLVAALKNAEESTVVADGAYEVESNVPVVAYQYNPLHFEMSSTYSYTNDASLLLPEHTLTGNYMVSTWPTWGHGNWQMPLATVIGQWDWWYPGFVAIAAVEDGTEITITSSTYTSGGTPVALAPGESATVTIDRGDVVQVYSQRPENSSEVSFCEDNGWLQTNEGNCPPTGPFVPCDAYCWCTDGDLTGTVVASVKPLAVFAGHMCTFMPYDSWACDHLEEMMFPLETWGTSAVMSAPMHPNGASVVPTLYRVLARNDGTHVTFSPSVSGDATLNAGEFVEFESEIDFMVEATDQVFVTQAMMGQDFFVDSDSGDPAMGSGVPLFQARGTYTFLTPATYTSNFLNVIAPHGTNVSLDGAPITEWNWIGVTDYSVARVPLAPGAHRAESEGDVGFGITTYGYASYTSYLYPGGMNLDSFLE